MEDERAIPGEGGKEGGAAAAWRRRGRWRVPAEAARAVVAEALGTALLVALGCLPAAARLPPLHRALAAAALVAALVQCFDGVSGAMLNPAVALAGAVAGRVGGRRAAALAAAHLLGAAAGAAALALLAGPGACAACVTSPGAGVGAARAAAVEALLAAVLALANAAHWRPAPPAAAAAPPGDSWPLCIGAVVAAISLAAGETTGGSANPARSFGPALLAAAFRHHWVYWVGPLGGAGAAALLARWLLPSPPPPPPPPRALDESSGSDRPPHRPPPPFEGPPTLLPAN